MVHSSAGMSVGTLWGLHRRAGTSQPVPPRALLNATAGRRAENCPNSRNILGINTFFLNPQQCSASVKYQSALADTMH